MMFIADQTASPVCSLSDAISCLQDGGATSTRPGVSSWLSEPNHHPDPPGLERPSREDTRDLASRQGVREGDIQYIPSNCVQTSMDTSGVADPQSVCSQPLVD